MAPVQKDALLAGESTVVELIFNTRTVTRPPMNLNKSANVMSNDLNNTPIPIKFTGKVVADTDTVATIAFGPGLLELNPESNKKEIFIENKSDSSSLKISQVGYLMDNFEIKLPEKEIKKGDKAKIEVTWKGDVPEYDIERSITFDTGSKASPRFTVAYLIKGTKGPRPAPVKPAVNPAASKNPVPQKPTTAKAASSTGTSAKQSSAAPSRNTANKPDSTKATSTPWGKEVWPSK